MAVGTGGVHAESLFFRGDFMIDRQVHDGIDEIISACVRLTGISCAVS
jgi:hypothetical protein